MTLMDAAMILLGLVLLGAFGWAFWTMSRDISRANNG